MDAAEPFNVPVNPVALGIPVSRNIPHCRFSTRGQINIWFNFLLFAFLLYPSCLELILQICFSLISLPVWDQDYFDVIDTPMDFGTICSNLESGTKYKNSEDVFNDVQYIWNNCFKYNNKGDYILDLMRRVKKNFSKYWTTAGLYSGQPKGADGKAQRL